MAREIQETRQHGPQWYRISKDDGAIMEIGSVAVFRAAAGSYRNPADVIQTGRFVTDFAIYADEFSLTEDELKASARALLASKL